MSEYDGLEELDEGEVPDEDLDPAPSPWRLVLLAVLLSAALLLGLGYMRLDFNPAPIKPVEVFQDQTNPLDDPELRIVIPFGAKAKQSCNEQCFAPGIDRKICLDRCDLLVVSSFASRILPPAPPAAEAASAAVNACQAVLIKDGSPAEVTAGIRRTALVLERGADDWTYTRVQAMRRFQQSERTQAHLRVSKDSADEAAIVVPALAQALCIRQIAATAELAILDRVADNDLYSELYFRDFEKTVLRSLAEQEQRVDALLVNYAATHPAVIPGSAPEVLSGGK